jgi:ABC-type Mn2+/Zn2+ transport system ATPase subunit
MLPYDRATCVQPVAGASAVEARGLEVRYPGAAAPSLSNFSLVVEKGTRVALVGANGAGKSTFLKAVAGLLPPTAGDLRVFGHEPARCRCRVAYLAQRQEVHWGFPATVEDLVMTGRAARLGWLKRPGAEDRAAVRNALERVGLSPVAPRPLSQLSGGQQQRALIARALAQEAELLLLDEPLNAVDAGTRASVGGLLADLCREGKTVLMATHHLGGPGEEADSAVHLAEGRPSDPCDHHPHGSEEPL